MDDYKSLALALLATGIAAYAVRWYTDPLRAIPTVGGSSLPGLSWYPESTFKLPSLDRWTVVVSGRELVEELRKRGDEELSAPEGAQDTLESKYIFDPAVLSDEYHVKLLQEKLTRRLPAVLPDIVDEVTAAVKVHIVTREDGRPMKYQLTTHTPTQLFRVAEWTSVDVMPVMQDIIARVSNRAFVGLPLCEKSAFVKTLGRVINANPLHLAGRNKEYLKLAVDFALDVMKSVVLLRLLPGFLKP
uniref:Repressed by TUP1 protein 4 n=1 Tax=Ganoderma boninense TaxID=34458 RepID=A0A5K1JX32_9APHY|nr:Repressed by TUP1 protein 4 [Ganoderma boninense]